MSVTVKWNDPTEKMKVKDLAEGVGDLVAFETSTGEVMLTTRAAIKLGMNDDPINVITLTGGRFCSTYHADKKCYEVDVDIVIKGYSPHVETEKNKRER